MITKNKISYSKMLLILFSTVRPIKLWYGKTTATLNSIKQKLINCAVDTEPFHSIFGFKGTGQTISFITA